LFVIKEKLSNSVRTLAFMGTLLVTFEERNTLIFFCVSLRTFFCELHLCLHRFRSSQVVRKE